MVLKNITKKTGSFILLDTLVRVGAKYIFGYPGGAILPIYDELFFWEKAGLIKHILVRHEQAAAHAADGYARATGDVGICFATSGPGATNLVTGIATAQMDSIPLVIITGQVSRNLIGTDAFQETDIFGITLPLVKHSYILKDTNNISEIIMEAFFIAKNGRPGPVLIDIPKDVGLEEYNSYEPKNIKIISKKRDFRYEYFLKKNIAKTIIKVLKQCSQPLLYVGGGAIKSNASKILKKFLEHFQVPITTTLMAKGIIDEKHQFALGMLGMHGTVYANFAVSECDLLMAIGARFDDRVTGKLEEFAAYADIIHIDIDPAEIGKNRVPHFQIIGDTKKILSEIIKESNKQINQIEKNLFFSWNQRLNRWKKLYPLEFFSSENSIIPQHAISLIGKIFCDSIITTDVGQHQMWSAQFLNSLPNGWISSSGLGTMGFGFPAAIGAYFSNKKFLSKDIVCITGDSSFQMCLQELGTIKQYNIPIKIFIINNNWQGMVRQWQQSFFGKRYSHSSMEEGMPNFELLAKSYDIKSYTIKNIKDLEKLLYSIKISDENIPIVTNIVVKNEENCYPMVSPGKSNSQMIGISQLTVKTNTTDN
jgi:acetolactate synthase-1/2/3 large subunit